MTGALNVRHAGRHRGHEREHRAELRRRRGADRQRDDRDGDGTFAYWWICGSAATIYYQGEDPRQKASTRISRSSSAGRVTRSARDASPRCRGATTILIDWLTRRAWNQGALRSTIAGSQARIGCIDDRHAAGDAVTRVPPAPSGPPSSSVVVVARRGARGAAVIVPEGRRPSWRARSSARPAAGRRRRAARSGQDTDGAVAGDAARAAAPR